MGSVSGLKSFEEAVCLWEGWAGLGEGDDDILSLREKSSWSASCVGRETITCGDACRRGDTGDCRGGTTSFGERSGRVSVDDDGWVEFVNEL